MKKDIDKNEWIDAFLKGELSDEETVKAQKLIGDDPSFANEVQATNELHQIILESSLLDIKNRIQNIHSHKIYTDKWIKRIIGFGLGASIIGIITFFSIQSHKNNNQPAKTLISDTIQQTNDNVYNANTNENKSQINISTKKIAVSKIRKTEKDTEKNIPNPLSIKTDSTKHINISNPVKESDTDNQLSKKEIEVEPDKAIKYPESRLITDCSKLKIEADYISSESCNNAPTGSITVIKESVKGGKTPYMFSLNSKTFNDSIVFSNLYSNIYNLYIKDANNCILKVARIMVGQKDCIQQYANAFAPLKEEIWQIPVKQDGRGTIQIFTKNGALVYTSKLSVYNSNTWNGANMSGDILPMGIYQFIIKYTDGEIFNGMVTIIK